MDVFKAGSARELLLQATSEVLSRGQEISPRGQRTVELSPVTLVLYDPADCIPNGINRTKLHPPLGVVEGLQDVAGISTVDLTCRVAPNYGAFLNADGGLDGAYGPRLGKVLGAVWKKLHQYPDTRQAMAAIWDAGDSLRTASKDYPCTLGLHFLQRNGKLDLHVRMRSNDLWWGTPYDIMQFCIVQLTMANALRVEPGTYYHVANSLHLYERDWEVAEALYREPKETFDVRRLTGVGHDMSLGWEEKMERAQQLLAGLCPMDATATELYFAESLKPFMPDEVRVPSVRPV